MHPFHLKARRYDGRQTCRLHLKNTEILEEGKCREQIEHKMVLYPYKLDQLKNGIFQQYPPNEEGKK